VGVRWAAQCSREELRSGGPRNPGRGTTFSVTSVGVLVRSKQCMLRSKGVVAPKNQRASLNDGSLKPLGRPARRHRPLHVLAIRVGCETTRPVAALSLAEQWSSRRVPASTHRRRYRDSFVQSTKAFFKERPSRLRPSWRCRDVFPRSSASLDAVCISILPLSAKLCNASCNSPPTFGLRLSPPQERQSVDTFRFFGIFQTGFVSAAWGGILVLPQGIPVNCCCCAKSRVRVLGCCQSQSWNYSVPAELRRPQASSRYPGLKAQ